jgi:CheY-like chemotaxis protein
MPSCQGDDHRPVIMVIDDDDAFRETAAALLEQLGYAVATAQSGDTAMQAIARNVPAIILLDLFMPGMDGFEFLKALRAAAVQVPVLITTGATTDVEQDPKLSRALANGANAILRKPFRIDELQRLIGQVAPTVVAAMKNA